jgi:WD40 repeat protein
LGYREDHAINSVKTLTEHTFVTGSDTGVVKLWDTRTRKHCNSFTLGDWITQFYLDEKLYCTCGDGRLASWDMRRKPLVLDSIDDELLCVNKFNSQLVVGTGEGYLLFYNKDLEIVNRMSNDESITQLVVSDDLYYASTDGCIRGLKSGVFAQQSTPIEHMLLHKDTLLTASESEIKTWPLKKQDFFNDLD